MNDVAYRLLIEYAAYVEAKIDADEMPYTFRQWWEAEETLRGDQLTLTTEEPGLLTDP